MLEYVYILIEITLVRELGVKEEGEGLGRNGEGEGKEKRERSYFVSDSLPPQKTSVVQMQVWRWARSTEWKE